MKVAFATEMNCSRAHLWNFFEDTEKLKLWVSGFEGLRITSPEPHGAGSTYVMRIREGRKVYEYQGKNLIWDPPRRIKEKLRGGRMKILMTVDYKFTDLGDRARLGYENVFTAQSFGTALFMPVLILMGRAYCKSMIKTLKRQAESDSPRVLS